jgi:hypothetical protein
VLVGALACGGLGGCKSGNAFNESFPVTLNEARDFLDEMEAAPIELERPLVVAGGIYDPGFITFGLARHLKKVATNDHPVITVTFAGRWTFDRCREKLIAAIEKAAPSGEPNETVEVDVVGMSMGGLVARYAAVPNEHGHHKRLRINRLFTVATPHRGARMAEIPQLDRRARDMRAGSSFLESLNSADRDYPIYAYTRLGDFVVGEANTAPPGQSPWWVARPRFGFGHHGAGEDPRILADIARRLRGEPPLTLLPPEPLPGHPALEEEATAAFLDAADAG